MDQVTIDVRNNDKGRVEMVFNREGQKEPTVVTLSPAIARNLGDRIFKAGCTPEV